MPETYRDYPVMEAAISLVDASPLASGAERVLLGDIVAIRHPRREIGTQERKRFLWLRLYGLDSNELDRLHDRMSLDVDVSYDKRRYAVRLDRLPGLNMTRALDLNDTYQPFLPVDEDTGQVLAEAAPFAVWGLVYDKAAGAFL